MLCLLIPFALAAPVRALDPPKSITQFTHTAWSAKDGIPGPVRAIAQTRDGYLWLGTEAGLYRFDGLRFTPYDPGRALPAAVLSLLAAQDGSLWMGFGSGGIARLRDGQLTHFPPGEGFPAGGIKSIAEDAAGSIWAAGPYGFVAFQNGMWRRVGMEMGYAAPGAQALLVDRAGTLWVATDGFNFGLSKGRRVNTILALARNATRFTPTGDAVGMIWSMAEASDGGVWIADTTGKTVRRIGRHGGDSITVSVEQSPLCLIPGSDGSLWIGLIEGGLRRARHLAGGGPLDQFGVKDQLSGSLVYAALKDREGNLWFGTGGGLDRFRENKVTPFSESEGLVSDQQIMLTSTPDGSVWLVSYTRDAVRRFRGGAFVSTTLEPYSPSDRSGILSIYASPAGQVWLGGRFKLAKEDHGTFSYVDVPGIESGGMVDAVAEDKAGDLWVTISTRSEVGRILRRRGGEWKDLRAQRTLPPYRSRVLHADAVGRMWLGFENGDVVVFEGDASRLYSTKEGLPSGEVLAIARDREGHVLIAGEGGLSRFAQDRFVTLTQDNGLPGTSVSAILEDDDGDLWLPGPLGILRVKPEELEKAFASSSYRVQGVAFDAADGLRGLPRQAPAPTATRAADGRLWFATTGGVAVIDPRRYPRNALAPPVKIERVVADDRDVEASAGLRLPPNTKRLEIQYTAASLTIPERVRFRYRLEGYDTAWRGPASARSATYTNLPPRSYRFQVIASNDDGVWNEQGAALEFTIAPAFHQTRAFIVLCAAAAGCLAWAVYRWRIRQVKTRLQLQFRERLLERTRIAQELHDTLLQGFLSASMQLHVVADHVPAESADKPRLNRVLELMRTVIEEGRNAVKGLRSPAAGHEADLEQALSRVREELNVKEAIDFRVIGQGQARPLDAVIRDEVYRIGREAVVNALQHSQANRIEVEVEFAAKGLRVAVRDDGRGIDPQLLQSGRDGHWGLAGMRERAKRIGGRLKVWSGADTGTEVEVSVPAGIAFPSQARRRSWRWLLRLYPGRVDDGK